MTRLGLARSIAMYYAQPWRRSALRRFYAQLVGQGDLVFDIGAHVGNRSLTLATLGARVIAVEPQPVFADFLERHIACRRIILVREALGREAGRATLAISRRHPTVSTLSRDWIGKVGGTPGFRSVAWDHEVEVPVTTLDALIARHGLPRFCKIDVEGMEAEILAGLSQPIPLVAIEHLPAAHDVSRAAIERLAALGNYRFNLVIGENARFTQPAWLGAEAMLAHLAADPTNGRSADIYARLCDAEAS